MSNFNTIMEQFFEDFETYAYHQGNLHFSHLINALRFIQNEKSLTEKDKNFRITFKKDGEGYCIGDIQGTPAFLKFTKANHRSKTKTSFLALMVAWVEFATLFELIEDNESLSIENGKIHLNFKSFTRARLKDIQCIAGFENLQIINET